jgi:hypothetical protein
MYSSRRNSRPNAKMSAPRRMVARAICTGLLTFSCTFQREPAETSFYYLAASISATMRLRWYTFRIPSSKARLSTAIDRFLAAS